MNDTTDGRPSEDAQFACVPASIAAGLQYLNGIHYSPDALKDSAYGEGWVNSGTSAEAFIPYCLAQGVKLTKLPSLSFYAAIALAHQELDRRQPLDQAKGHPVIFTQQDDYAPSQPTWTHVCVWYKSTAATLTAMDPYGGKPITFDDLTWAARLRSRDIWTMEKVSSMQPFIDVSGFQPTIDWHAYKQWSSCVAMKTTEGVGYTDPTFAAHRSGALGAGIGTILYYHFARPDLGNTPSAEADWMRQTVGAIRANDLLVLDFEVSPPQATADWAYRFLAHLEQIAGVRPAIYASTSYIGARLQDSRLAHFPLWLANWTFDAGARPPCPAPWTSYIALQYTDNATSIPGVPGAVDANIFLGGSPMPIPTGWKDDGKKLTAPNGHSMTLGFRDWVINAANFDATDQPQEEAQTVAQVEMHSQSGAGTRQILRDQMLIWTQAHGVHASASGMEIAAAYSQIAALQKQVAALQAQLKVPADANVAALTTKLAQVETLAASIVTVAKA